MRLIIETDRPYPVEIGPGLLKTCGERIAALHAPCKAAVIADHRVAALYAKRVCTALERSGFTPCLLTFPAGEQSKHLDTLGRLLAEMAERGLTRADLVVALGGGVAGDMAGFAAGVYQRGLPFVQLPTSLLAAVDASVGGKTAVDLPQGKNLVGLFHQPLAVLCDTDTLATLPPQWMRDGLGECVKCGVLCDPALFDRLGGEPLEDLEAIIGRCVEIKRDYVVGDETEQGKRKFLNLGHTFAHAIERLSGYTFPHGHAVAVGLTMIARAGEKLDITAPGTCAALETVLTKLGLPTASPYAPEALAEAALGDKKRAGAAITLVIPERIGACRLETVPVSALGHIAALGKEGP